MKIAFNPSTVAALTTPPNNKDITFDLMGRNIFARGVKFYGTDTNTWRDIKINNVSIGSYTLDLRNGSNTTLTNTNGIVTINSTWRPVVDNLTSDSTTSSLSAQQGKVLKALIDGKSDSDHNHDDRYLKLTGGTMAGTAMITFADSGSGSKQPQGARGGLYWTGQSDQAKLYAEETADDNLDLVIQFGDDNSNGLSIRNKANTQTSYISSSGVITTGTFKGNLDWSYITNKPSSYPPSAHTHAWNSLTHSSTTENQAILTNGEANSWKLYTLNIYGWDNAANNAHSHANKSVLDGITSALVNSWNTAYNFVSNITGTDTDEVINKWEEIVNFLAGITEDNKLNTLLNSKLSVYELANNTNVGTIKNNGIYYSTTDASSSTLTNSPFNNGFTLINMTSFKDGGDLRRSRLAFNAYGEIKVSDDRNYADTAETWYNVLTSKNSGISGSTIKLNGTSITVYSSDTSDDRYVKKSGDTMYGALTIDTTNFGALTIKRNDDANDASIQFRGKSSVYGYIGLNNSTKDKQFLRWSSDTSRVYTILDTSSTYISNGKGVINGTTITQVDNADMVDGYHENSFLRYREATNTDREATLWSQIGIKEYQNALPDGLTNTYNWGGVISLPGEHSRFEIYASHWSSSSDGNNGLYYRSGWNSDKKPWLKLIDSSNIDYQTVSNAYHLQIYDANAWSNWYWAGQSGQPSWLWGSNDGTNMYIWNPSNFNVNTAQYLRSLGNQDCQTGRNQAYGDVYTYNTYEGNTGSPTNFTSVIGFGRGLFGTVEIAGGWWNSNLYWRSLRDCCEGWTPWRVVLDSSNYLELISNYYWADVKISTSSSTTTSPTVQNLTATSSIRMSDISLEHTNEINNITNGVIYLNYRNSGNVSLCQGGGSVGIGTLSPTQKLDVEGNIRARGIKFGEGGMYIGYDGSSHYSSGTSLWTNFNADTVDGEHASNFSYTHQTSFDFSRSKSGRIVTFDQSNTTYGWINGFASTYNNQLTSVIFNKHRSSNWYVGYMEGNTSTGETLGLQAAHKLAFADGDEYYPIFLGYLTLYNGDDGIISSTFPCLGYSVPFTYTRGGHYCRIVIPDTPQLVFYIKAAIASVHYSGGGMDTWTGSHRGTGAWWLHCYAVNANEVRVKGFCTGHAHNDSWWGGNALWADEDGTNRITVCLFGYVRYR